MRGQRLSVSKKELFDQLKKALDENVVVGGGKKRQKDKVIKRSDGESGMGKFPLSAHWRILDPSNQRWNQETIPSKMHALLQ